MSNQDRPDGAFQGLDDFYLDELTGLEEHLRDSEYQGDPRRCPRHPHVATSTPDGFFDMCCNICEGEMSDWAEEWDHDPANPQRRYCGDGRRWFPTMPSRGYFACLPDPIPF